MIFEKEKVLKEIKEDLIKNNLILSCAESCTGGLISSYLTDISGASGFIFQNFVTYSNDAKNKFLDVSLDTLNKYGAVSEQTAFEMGLGLLKYADVGLATTGILGPTGGSKEKPVGLVYIAVSFKGKVFVSKYISCESHSNDRCKIKIDIVQKAIEILLNFLKNTLN